MEGSLRCDKCHSSNTSEKWIKSKKTGKNYKVYECNNGCMNGRFTYSFFPPRDSSYAAAPQKKAPETKEASPFETVLALKDVIERLKRIELGLSDLRRNTGTPAKDTITPDEMEPDDLPPF